MKYIINFILMLLWSLPMKADAFFEDYCNWQRIPEFKKCAEESPAAQIVAEATGSKSIQLFHEHIFIKDPGTAKETPWHQDMPYYCVDGNDTGSFWIPLDPISKDNSLQILLGQILMVLMKTILTY